jgi:tetratricopeptide (TPR) repeat protein
MDRKHTKKLGLLLAALAAAALLSAGLVPGTVTFCAAQDESDLPNRLKELTPRQQLGLLEELKAGGRDDAKIPFYMGNAMYALGKLDSATIFFQEAAAQDSMFSKAYVNLGLALDAQGQFFGAELAFQSALRADPNDVLAYCHLGYLYYSKQRYTQAMQNYQKALTVDPQSAQAHYYLGLAFADAHIFKEALAEWELVVSLQPDGELGKTAKENVELIKQFLQMKTP